MTSRPLVTDYPIIPFSKTAHRRGVEVRGDDEYVILWHPKTELYITMTRATAKRAWKVALRELLHAIKHHENGRVIPA